MSCIIRKMALAETEIAAYLAYLEGWNPGISDGYTFYMAYPNDFFLAEIDGVVAGCISAIKYSEEYGFIGFYVVLPEYRRSLVGVKLALTALNHLDGCNIGIDGVPARIENYERIGFNKANNNARFETIGTNYAIDDHIVFTNSIDKKLVYNYDLLCFPVARTQFLDYWLAMPNVSSYTFIKDGQIQGWGLIRQCRKGYKIGPLFADSFEIADSIYKALVNHAIDELVYLDIPVNNESALKLTKKYDMKIVFETARMYSKHEPDIDINKIFGITTFELG